MVYTFVYTIFNGIYKYIYNYIFFVKKNASKIPKLLSHSSSFSTSVIIDCIGLQITKEQN